MGPRRMSWVNQDSQSKVAVPTESRMGEGVVIAAAFAADRGHEVSFCDPFAVASELISITCLPRDIRDEIEPQRVGGQHDGHASQWLREREAAKLMTGDGTCGHP